MTWHFMLYLVLLYTRLENSFLNEIGRQCNSRYNCISEAKISDVDRTHPLSHDENKSYSYSLGNLEEERNVKDTCIQSAFRSFYQRNL